MDIKDCSRVKGKGVFATKNYKINDIIHILDGEVKLIPNKYSIEIGKDMHIIDDYGKFINHSFSPNAKIDENKVIAIKNISSGEEICYNYNDSESVMASPFYCNGILVSGKNDKAIKKRFTIPVSKGVSINNIENIIKLLD